MDLFADFNGLPGGAATPSSTATTRTGRTARSSARPFRSWPRWPSAWPCAARCSVSTSTPALRHRLQLQRPVVHQKPRREVRQRRPHHPRTRTGEGVPRHLARRHPLVSELPARPPDRGARIADQERLGVRADRRRKRASCKGADESRHLERRSRNPRSQNQSPASWHQDNCLARAGHRHMASSPNPAPSRGGLRPSPTLEKPCTFAVDGAILRRHSPEGGTPMTTGNRHDRGCTTRGNRGRRPRADGRRQRGRRRDHRGPGPGSRRPADVRHRGFRQLPDPHARAERPPVHRFPRQDTARRHARHVGTPDRGRDARRVRLRAARQRQRPRIPVDYHAGQPQGVVRGDRRVRHHGLARHRCPGDCPCRVGGSRSARTSGTGGRTVPTTAGCRSRSA